MEEFKAPNVSNEQLSKITEIKAGVQETLMMRAYGHYPKDEEALAWVQKYGKNLNYYFVDHPEATQRDIESIESFLQQQEHITDDQQEEHLH